MSMGKKEKKIDWYLSIAGFMQLCVFGLSGSLYTEIKEHGAWSLTAIGLALLSAISLSGLALTWLYINKNLRNGRGT